MSELTNGAMQIAVLDRGFVFVGRCHIEDEVLTITGAKNVRRWGTERGLGQLAEEGPSRTTILDYTGTLRAPVRSVIFLIDCAPEAWPETA